MRYFLDDVNAIGMSELRDRPVTPKVRVTFAAEMIAPGDPAALSILLRLSPDFEQILEAPEGREVFDAFVNYIVNTDKLSVDAADLFADRLGPVAKEVTMATFVSNEARVRAQVLLELLADRFGSPDPSVEQVVRQADVAQLKVWASRVLTAATVDEVLS